MEVKSDCWPAFRAHLGLVVIRPVNVVCFPWSHLATEVQAGPT